MTDEERIAAIEDETIAEEASTREAAKAHFDDPRAFLKWYTSKSLHNLSLMKREKASSRQLRLDGFAESWQRIYRLCSETVDQEELREEVAELRRFMESMNMQGPKGVVGK